VPACSVAFLFAIVRNAGKVVASVEIASKSIVLVVSGLVSSVQVQ
jgi:hypothetical protein